MDEFSQVPDGDSHGIRDDKNGEPVESASAEPTPSKTSARHRDALDRVDRSVVIGDYFKRVSMWSLRLVFVAAAVFILWWVIGRFWQGVLPVTLAIIICTVLSSPNSWLRKHGVPSVLSA
ncbi:MAG TPA: AI-2E family transporter, partial [Corynebacterium glutamicum]|nr:AI-2E family transporter [Corynebacterium glutamicum]